MVAKRQSETTIYVYGDMNPNVAEQIQPHIDEAMRTGNVEVRCFGRIQL